MSSSSPTMPAPITIARYEFAIYPAMAMLAGMHLDLFTLLMDGPLTGQTLR